MKFNLNEEYNRYLEMVGLSEDTMHPAQKIETKRAWYAGAGQILILFRDKIAAIEDENKAIAALEDIETQILKFWDHTLKL